MLSYQNALCSFQLIEKSKFKDLKAALYKAAIRYANFRTEWGFLETEQKKDTDDERTAAHNRFIDACNILSRNQANIGEDNSWRKELGEDRKIIGDFACYIHVFIGIRNR